MAEYNPIPPKAVYTVPVTYQYQGHRRALPYPDPVPVVYYRDGVDLCVVDTAGRRWPWRGYWLAQVWRAVAWAQARHS